MAQTPPPSITPAPTPAPQRGDRATFSPRVDAFVTWLTGAVGQFAAVATNVYNNALDAFNSASAATSAASSATAAVNAVPWVSGTTYQQYAAVISPLDGYTYRRRTAAGSGATDPSQDATNWISLTPKIFTRRLVLRSTQSWQPPPGVTLAEITVVDGGYSGGTTTSSGNTSSAGRGGNASNSIIVVNPAVTYNATVGAGGAGPAAGTSLPPVAGGSSSFSGSGISTITSAAGDIVVPGGKPVVGTVGAGVGIQLGGESVYALASEGNGTGIGGGGAATSANLAGFNGSAGGIIIRY